MHTFYSALTYVNNMLYIPLQLIISNVREENNNSDYGAALFQLNSKSIRFRVAKVTPTKIGQFVSIWEKDVYSKNQAYSYEVATDLLVINAFSGENRFGQFVFPKSVLLQKGILRTVTKKGKMAIRVYPAWDKPTSKQAVSTQKWQLEYFYEVNSNSSLQALYKLYN